MTTRFRDYIRIVENGGDFGPTLLLDHDTDTQTSAEVQVAPPGYVFAVFSHAVDHPKLRGEIIWSGESLPKAIAQCEELAEHQPRSQQCYVGIVADHEVMDGETDPLAPTVDEADLF